MPPWVEKYRPARLDDVVGQTRVVKVLRAYVAVAKAGGSDCPNFLFSGPSGTGKTSAAQAFVREVLGNSWRLNYMDLNASDDRGIDVIREQVKPMAAADTLSGPNKFIFLDEADQITKEAQFALRRVMEDYSKTCRFILSCNFPNRLIDAVRSRCFSLMFKPIPKDQGVAMLERICKEEGVVSWSSMALRTIIDECRGDLRSSIGLLQTVATSEKEVTEATVFNYIGKTPKAHVETIMNTLVGTSHLDEKMKAIDAFMVTVEDDGVSWEGLLYDVAQFFLVNTTLPHMSRASILARVGETVYWCNNVANPMLQVRSFFYWALTVINKGNGS